jgi:lysophospholipase L1-like esterase
MRWICLAASLSLNACGGGGGTETASGTTASVAPTTNASVPAASASGPAASGTSVPVLYHAAWTTALVDANAPSSGLATAQAPVLSNQSLRQVLRLSLGGERFRLRISNIYGTAPLTLTSLHIARSTGGSGIDVSSDRAVSFGGQASVTLAPGSEALSDPVSLSLPSSSSVAVSMYFSGQAALSAVHDYARSTSYVAAGDLSAAPSFPAAAQTLSSYYGLASVEAVDAETARVVIAFGDSITDGVNSTFNAPRSYPDQLNDRLRAAGYVRTGVVNAGIAGNRWLADGVGPSGSKRLARDVLNVAGASHVILLLGINDLLLSASSGAPDEVSADQITAAISAAANQARAKGLKVLVGTLLPCRATGLTEAKRQMVNAWIRAGGNADGVVDFDAAMRDSADPASLNAAYDSGDHLHPNDAGYAAMAAAVNLSLLQ